MPPSPSERPRDRSARPEPTGLRPTGSRRLSTLILWISALLALVVATTGCNPKEPANLANVVDVAPRDVEVGDHVEVLGTNLPSGNLKGVTVSLRGELFRPGQKKPADASSVGPIPALPAPDKVSFVFTEELQARLCGSGDRASHTTFRGDVIVDYPPQQTDGSGGAGIRGVVRRVTIDFRPPSLRRMVLADREQDAQAAIKALGITLDIDGSDRAGGLRVAEVKDPSAAKEAKLARGDVIVSFNGVSVRGITDLLPVSGSPTATMEVQRGKGPLQKLEISTKDVPSTGIPTEILAAIILLAVAAVVLIIIMAPFAGIITWVERRVSGRMQSRIGPNRTGPGGFLQWLADGVKSLMKEDVVPTEADRPLFLLAPYLVFLGVSATFVVMPFGQYLISADLDIGILFVIAVTSLVAIGLLTGGWASNNKWSLIGGIRAAAQVVSYEIPAAVAIVCIVMMTGSLRMQDIIHAQGGMGSITGGIQDLLTTGGWPWYWYAFRNPVTFGLFFLYFVTALAEGNRAPFDMPEAESELVAGYSTEYSGMRYVFFFFAEWANVFVMSAIVSALFLGGWQVPGVSAAAQENSVWLQVLGAAVFQLKSWTLVFVVIWVRWTLPRIRIDQLMGVCWKWLVPLAFAGFALTGLWVLGTSQPFGKPTSPDVPASPLITPLVELAIGVGMFAVSLVLLVHFIRRVHFNLKSARVPIHVNPFL